MKKYKILITCCIVFITINMNASKIVNVDPVVNIMESYVELINSIEKDSSIDKMLDLYSQMYTGNTTYVKLSGGIVKKSYTKENIKNQLLDIVQDGNYSLKMKMNRVLYSSQKDNSGTISSLLDFESVIDDKIAEKGTILMNIVIVKQKEQWKITQNNMVRVSEVKDIGDCVCHIFEKGSTQFVTELYYPAGVKYDHKFEAFKITSNDTNRFIKSGGKTFIWEKSSNKVMLDQNELGEAKNPNQVIELLIKKMNTETCAAIIFR